MKTINHPVRTSLPPHNTVHMVSVNFTIQYAYNRDC